MSGKTLITILLPFLFMTNLHSRDTLRYHISDKYILELTGELSGKKDGTVHHYSQNISGTGLQDICLEKFNEYEPIDCNSIYLQRTYVDDGNDNCLIGFINSENYADYNIAFYIFRFPGETIIARRDSVYESYFLDIPLGLVNLFFSYARKYAISDSVIKKYILKLISWSMSDNQYVWYHPVGPPAYEDIKYDSETGRDYEIRHDFSLLKSFMYDHYPLGCQSDYMMYCINEYVLYSQKHSCTKDREILEKDIIYDLLEFATMANPPSVASRLPYKYSIYGMRTKTVYPSYYEAIRSVSLLLR